MEFRSQENKQILYQILSSHPLKSINEGRFASAIEAQVNLVYKERFKFKNALVEMKANDTTIIKADGEDILKAKYSLEYLKKMITCEKISDKVSLSFNTDYPLKL